jgi:hypothetical protein
MRIRELSNGLLVAPLEITYRGITHILEDVVIDTGAVRSILHVDAVDVLDINPSPSDPPFLGCKVSGAMTSVFVGVWTILY